jgi:Dolichyl-phosphate-mannose-protein mannosyltransferase
MNDIIPGSFKPFKIPEKTFLFLVLSLNFLIKAIPASLVELGNDEVYYWTYALFPDWSHFDHPPMVGFTIQLFSLNLAFHNEFFIRLGSLILSSASLLLLFYLVKKIYSLRAAFISSLLFTASFYFNVISGLFILPDTPQIFFVMLALYFGIPAIIQVNPAKKDSTGIILFGFFTGLAFLSKYHSLFLWFGFGLFILFNNRSWLKRPSLYLSVLITLVLMLPVVFWNINNNFISFTFHGSRIGLSGSPLDPVSFMQFNIGQILYQNPVLFVIFILTLIALFRNRKARFTPINLLLLYLSIPLILIFTFFSLFKSTLPHWTGPAFIGLIMLSSEYLARQTEHNRRSVVGAISAANILVILLLIVAPLQINRGLFYSPSPGPDPTKVGEDDITLDMYGWKQAGIKFEEFLRKEGIEDEDHNRVKILSNKWFPAAHLDFYVAYPLNIDLLVSGDLGDAHKYYWINRTRRINPGDRIFYITTSQSFVSPEKLPDKFREIIPRDTIAIKRHGRRVENIFIYEMVE